ncbi:MAG: DNA cytosine methyltransferase, partial [Ruthenibacterium sp.]
MRYGSVCSGVEAASLAWGKLGWQPVFFSEVEPFPCAVLHHRFGASRPLHGVGNTNWDKQNNKLPLEGTIPNDGDFTKIGDKYAGKIDILAGGTPCQSFSISGNRAGLGGVSGLALDFIELAYKSKAKWVVWENVPGIFSSNGGRDFTAFLSGLAGQQIDVPVKGWKTAGLVRNVRTDRYGLAWRVLDAQYVRVDGFPHAIPQRRRRVFVVGYFGDWRRAAEVLFEPKGLLGDTKPRRIKREKLASSSESGIDLTKWCNGGNVADTLTVASNDQFMPDKSRLQCV